MTPEIRGRLHQNDILSTNTTILKINSVNYPVKSFCRDENIDWQKFIKKKGPAMQSLVFLFSFFQSILPGCM